jgi:hypothetical protein
MTKRRHGPSKLPAVTSEISIDQSDGYRCLCCVPKHSLDQSAEMKHHAGAIGVELARTSRKARTGMTVGEVIG